MILFQQFLPDFHAASFTVLADPVDHVFFNLNVGVDGFLRQLFDDRFRCDDSAQQALEYEIHLTGNSLGSGFLRGGLLFNRLLFSLGGRSSLDFGLLSLFRGGFLCRSLCSGFLSLLRRSCFLSFGGLGCRLDALLSGFFYFFSDFFFVAMISYSFVSLIFLPSGP